MRTNESTRRSSTRKVQLSIALVVALMAPLFAFSPAAAVFEGTQITNPDAFTNRAIGRVYNEASEGACTATLISPTHVITSAHCVTTRRNTSPNNALFQNVKDPVGGIDFYWDDTGDAEVNDFATGDTAVPIKRFEVPPEYLNANADGLEAPVESDIALLELAQPIVGVTPYRLDFTNVEDRDVVTFFGRGWYTNVRRNNQGRLFRGSAPSTGNCFGSMTCLDGVNGESSPCSGDSGGPGFVGDRIATIHAGSFRDDECGRGQIFQVQVAQWETWIRAEIINGQTCNGLAPTVIMDLGETPTPYADVILGTAAHDEIVALAGHDTICARGGHDIIYGGNGRDRIYGGNGDDEVRGQAGNDTLFGGKGNDRIYGGNGVDKIRGNEGNDRLYGGAHNDTLYGNTGADVMFGGSHNDTLTGNSGTDSFHGGTGFDTFLGAFDFETQTGGEA